MSAAGLEAIGVYSPDAPRWYHQIQGMRNADGTLRQAGRPCRSPPAASAAAILRLGMPLEHRDAIVKAIKAGQRPEGGWSKDDGPPDLSSSYRIMRAMFMMHERPDHRPPARLRRPLPQARRQLLQHARRRGQPRRHLPGHHPRLLVAAAHGPARRRRDGRVHAAGQWRLARRLGRRQATLVGEGRRADRPVAAAWTTTSSWPRPGRTAASCSRSISDWPTARGIAASSSAASASRAPRCRATRPISARDSGARLYDESRRNTDARLSPGRGRARRPSRRAGTDYNIRAMGDRITLTLNGSDSVLEYRETDPSVARDGLIAVQMHAGGSTEVQFRDMMIQPLPTPTAADAEPAGVPPPHAQDRQRRAEIHGLRARGIRRHQDVPGGPVPPRLRRARRRRDRPGAGGARPGDPTIARAASRRSSCSRRPVRPGRPTRPTDKAALQALDEVMRDYKVDPKRVILTGLSMGGHGSWDIGTAHPERFAAVVPICGPGDPETVRPAQGSARLDLLRRCRSRRDRAQPPHHGRGKLRAAGNAAKLTEYRGVGHNSWDRAYNSPELIDWMLAQARP